MTYAEKVAAGLCGMCGNVRKTQSPLCDVCKDKCKQRAAVKRAKNKESGACLNCGQAVGTRSSTKCDKCLDIGLASMNKARVVRKEKGICQNCGQRVAMRNKTVCSKCSRNMSVCRMKHYEIAKTAGLCPSCGTKEPVEGYKQCQQCRDTDAEYKATLRAAVINAYGGPTCSGCGSADYNVLEIDHIAGGGRKHLKAEKITSGNGFYLWLKRNNFPTGFRVLCPTCNKKAHKKIPLPNNQV